MHPFGFCLVLSLLLLPLGCRPLLPAERPQAMDLVPATFQLYPAAPAAVADRPWWQDFASPELDQLIDQALCHNPDLQQLWARLRQSRALARSAAAAHWPELTADASAGHSRGRSGAVAGSESVQRWESFTLALLSSYELDLWGRVSAQSRAGELGAQAAAEDVYAGQLTLTAQVCLAWLDVQAAAARLPLAHQQVTLGRQRLELLVQRFGRGQASGIDIADQQQRLAADEAELARLGEALQQARLELALLVGTAAPLPLPAVPADLPDLPALPSPGLPADLLARRPDVRAAGLRLRAADWQVSAAQAQRLPAVRLTAGLSANSTALAELLDGWLANLAASVSGPLLDGGRRRAEVERSRAQVAEQLAAYRQTVLRAVQEVELALTQEQQRGRIVAALQAQLTQQQRLCLQQRERYLAGTAGYLELLAAEQARLALAQQLLQARREVLAARVALQRALAGQPLRPPSAGSQAEGLAQPLQNHVMTGQ